MLWHTSARGSYPNLVLRHVMTPCTLDHFRQRHQGAGVFDRGTYLNIQQCTPLRTSGPSQRHAFFEATQQTQFASSTIRQRVLPLDRPIAYASYTFSTASCWLRNPWHALRRSIRVSSWRSPVFLAHLPPHSLLTLVQIQSHFGEQ